MVQKYKPKKIFPKKKRKIDVFIIDEISIKVGYEYVWLWGIIEPKDKEIYLPYEISAVLLSNIIVIATLLVCNFSIYQNSIYM